jgi:alkaline phosphatase D
MPDGPDKTIWGEEQKEWLFETVQASDATYKLVISPTPIVGPDRDDKYDNHTNPSFNTEGEEIRAFLSSIDNLYVIAGDRHWQYVSEDPDTGLIEFASGPTTDGHASGFTLEERLPMHKYLKIKGGFLVVEVSPDEEDPEITFTHHSVDGTVYNQVALRPE